MTVLYSQCTTCSISSPENAPNQRRQSTGVPSVAAGTERVNRQRGRSRRGLRCGGGGGGGVRGGCFVKISRPSLKYRGRTVNLALSASARRLGINHLGRQIRVQSNNSHRAQKQREKVSRIYYPFGGSLSPRLAPLAPGCLAADSRPLRAPLPSPPAPSFNRLHSHIWKAGFPLLPLSLTEWQSAAICVKIKVGEKNNG